MIAQDAASSAVANAETTQHVDVDALYVKRAFVDEGPTAKRFLPRAHGRATRVFKRTSHITVVVDERGAGGEAEPWDRRYIRRASASASSRAGTRAGSRGATTPSCCTRTSEVRNFLKKRLYHAGISKIEIERAANKAKINIHTARPGIVIGKKGAEIEKLKSELDKLTAQGDASSTSTRCAVPTSTRSWWPRTSRCSSSAASPSAAR